MRQARPWLVVATAAVLIGTAGCTGQSADSSAAPASTPVSTIKPDATATAHLRQLWSNNQTAIGSLTDFAVVGDTAVLTGTPENPYQDYSSPTVAGVDLHTGKQRWLRDADDQRNFAGGRTLFGVDPLVAVPNNGGQVFVTYLNTACTTGMCPRSTSPHTDELGVQALSARDGLLLWSYAVTPAVPEGTAQADVNARTDMDIVGATATDLIINISNSEARSGGATTQKPGPSVVAVDLASGAISWHVDGVRADLTTPTAVLAHGGQPGLQARSTTAGLPVVLAAADGRISWIWKPNQPAGRSAAPSSATPTETIGASSAGSSEVSGAPQPTAAKWVSATGSAGLLSPTGGTGAPEVLIDTAKGVSSRTLPVGQWTLGTDNASRPLLADISVDYPDYWLSSMTQNDQAPAIGGELLPKGSFSVETVAGGRVAVSSTLGAFGLFDRSGHSLAAGVGGYFRYLDDGYLVAGSGSGDVGFDVYSIG
ncbi:MAG: hypothetical protein ACR2P2_06160 [Nakamurella sp.]